MSVPDEFFISSRNQAESDSADLGLLADAVDPNTGELLSLFRGFDPTDGAVLTAIERIRGSGSAVLDTGHRFTDATHVDDQLPSFVQLEAERCLGRLIAAGDIKLQPVELRTATDGGGDWAQVVLVYENLRRGERRRLPLPIRTRIQVP